LFDVIEAPGADRFVRQFARRGVEIDAAGRPLPGRLKSELLSELREQGISKAGNGLWARDVTRAHGCAILIVYGKTFQTIRVTCSSAAQDHDASCA
jgi:hypothetical protein